MKVRVIQVIEISDFEKNNRPIKVGDITISSNKVIKYYDLNGKHLATRNVTDEELNDYFSSD